MTHPLLLAIDLMLGFFAVFVVGMVLLRIAFSLLLVLVMATFATFQGIFRK